MAPSGSEWKLLQEYLVNTGVTRDSTLDPIHAYDTTQNRSKCNEAFDLGQHEVACSFCKNSTCFI